MRGTRPSRYRLITVMRRCMVIPSSTCVPGCMDNKGLPVCIGDTNQMFMWYQPKAIMPVDKSVAY